MEASAPGLTVNAGLRYDLQFLETINTDTNNLSPRVGLRVVAVRLARDTVVRGSAGLFYDRVPLRALANALLSAGNTTDLTSLRQISVSLSPTQAGAPVFPNILSAPVPLVTLVNFTTMDPDMQNAYSRAGQRGGGAAARASRAATAPAISTSAGENLIISVNQNVPSCVAAGTNNGCRPNPDYANNSQYSSVARLQLSRPAPVVRAAAGRLGQLPRQLHAVEVDEQRRRELLQLADRSVRPLEGLGPIRRRPASSAGADRRGEYARWTPARDAVAAADARLSGEQHGPGVFGAAVQHHVRRDDRSGHARAGRSSTAQFIPRNAGVGSDFFSLAAGEPLVPNRRSRVRAEGMVEAFNLTNRRNDLTRIGNFGAGTYPTSPRRRSTRSRRSAIREPCSSRFAFASRG